jgi:hypothetical protein
LPIIAAIAAFRCSAPKIFAAVANRFDFREWRPKGSSEGRPRDAERNADQPDAAPNDAARQKICKRPLRSLIHDDCSSTRSLSKPVPARV